MKGSEPHKIKQKKNTCSYCGDAPISHTFSFIESVVSVTLDNQARKFIKYVPRFVKIFADKFPEYLFRTFIFFRLAKFSNDINKASSFRSKIIWEEAQRRGICMEQVIFLRKPLDFYRAKLETGGKKINFYFESIPMKWDISEIGKNWDDKVFLKHELKKHNIPIPAYFELSIFSLRFKKNIKEIFEKLSQPIIVKPRVGSRGRHTITNIHSLPQLRNGIDTVIEISSYFVVEEHLSGSVCRATFVNGALAGFYRGQAPTLVGDGQKTIKELIDDMDNSRQNRVEPVRLGKEFHDHISRAGFSITDVLPQGVSLPLSHRIGRLFGGQTMEMIDDLHPSFIPILEKAEKVVGLPVIGFDCIIPDPTRDQAFQKWGIIECNTLPFIDLHYFALKGKPRNIAGMIWDMWS